MPLSQVIWPSRTRAVPRRSCATRKRHPGVELTPRASIYWPGWRSNPGDGAAGDGHPLAPHGMARVLDVEAPSATAGPAAHQQGAARADREDRNREPALGRRPHPGRATRARLRGERGDGEVLPAEGAAASAVPVLANLPRQPPVGRQNLMRPTDTDDANLRAAACCRLAGSASAAPACVRPESRAPMTDAAASRCSAGRTDQAPASAAVR